MANVFFKAGYVESWGRGTTKMISSCREAGLPDPLIEEDQGGFRVVFRKDNLNEEALEGLGLNIRQISAVLYVKEKGYINNSEYQKLNVIGKSVAAVELQQLADQKILSRVGNTGRSTRYIIYAPDL